VIERVTKCGTNCAQCAGPGQRPSTAIPVLPPPPPPFPYTTLFRSLLRRIVSAVDVTKTAFDAPVGDQTARALAELDVVWQSHARSEEHTSELQSRENLVCRLLLEKKKLRTTYAPRTSGPSVTAWLD